jgi:hypothetical protein
MVDAPLELACGCVDPGVGAGGEVVRDLDGQRKRDAKLKPRRGLLARDLWALLGQCPQLIERGSSG